MTLVELFTQPETFLAILSLTALEVVLGIDNIVFIAILTGRLPEAQRPMAYRVGLIGAMGTRLALLAAIGWVMGLDDPLFTAFGRTLTGHDLVLLVGGLFLLGKASHEIYEKVELQEGHEDEEDLAEKADPKGFAMVIIQIALLDIVFSLDSVITAVGMANDIRVMMAAVIVSVGIMLFAARPIGEFVQRHPSMTILALSFLLLIGLLLVAEALGQHVDKAMIYFAMGFSFMVQLLELRFRKNSKRSKRRVTLP